MHPKQLSCQEDGAVYPICQAVALPAQVNTLTFNTTSNLDALVKSRHSGENRSPGVL